MIMMIAIGTPDVPHADDRLVEQQQRGTTNATSATQHPLHRQVAVRLGDGLAAALARRGDAAADAGHQRVAQREQRPYAADQHRADAEVADLRAPDRERGVFRRGAGDGRGQRRVLALEEGVVDRDRDVP